jgi:DNA-binding transcriptional regulator LsrR (DeoR family)
MGPACRVKPTPYWADLCAEVDWMFGHGMDTVDIAAALSVHEAVVARALTNAREARRQADEAREGRRWA